MSVSGVSTDLDAASAAHQRALYAAENTDSPADWQTALQYLEEAAALGHSLAQAELAALAGDWPLSRERRKPASSFNGNPKRAAFRTNTMRPTCASEYRRYPAALRGGFGSTPTRS